MRPVGYVHEQSYFCADCSDGEGSPIWSYTETDIPMHCEQCEELIPCAPTRECRLYIKGAVRRYLDGWQGGSPAVMETWCRGLLGKAVDLNEMRLMWRGPEQHGEDPVSHISAAYQMLFYMDQHAKDQTAAGRAEELDSEVRDRLPNGLTWSKGQLEINL